MCTNQFTGATKGNGKKLCNGPYNRTPIRKSRCLWGSAANRKCLGNFLFHYPSTTDRGGNNQSSHVEVCKKNHFPLFFSESLDWHRPMETTKDSPRKKTKILYRDKDIRRDHFHECAKNVGKANVEKLSDLANPSFPFVIFSSPL